MAPSLRNMFERPANARLPREIDNLLAKMFPDRPLENFPQQDKASQSTL
ncbi:MAG: hypothetical protein AB7T38_09525 [Nitrospirales bacterium]